MERCRIEGSQFFHLGPTGKRRETETGFPIRDIEGEAGESIIPEEGATGVPMEEGVVEVEDKTETTLITEIPRRDLNHHLLGPRGAGMRVKPVAKAPILRSCPKGEDNMVPKPTRTAKFTKAQVTLLYRIRRLPAEARLVETSARKLKEHRNLLPL